MTKVRVAGFSLSLDGFGAGPDQSLDHPLGRGGEDLHEWLVETDTFRGQAGGEPAASGQCDPVDEAYAARSMEGVGAWIMGRNMFGPVRGDWPDENWKGWWGENPPYHVPVFVLTHYPRKSIEMEGGTVFHFISDGIEAALERAKAAAGSFDIRIGGGVSTVRQYVQAGLVDEMHLAIAPILLGRGEAMFTDLDLAALGYRVTEHAATHRATHVVLSK